VDVGTLGRGIKLGTINILVWVMGFMAHGYATEEFEVKINAMFIWRKSPMMYEKTDLISLTGCTRMITSFPEESNISLRCFYFVDSANG